MTEPFTEPELMLKRSEAHPFKQLPELVRLREERPLARMIYPDGHEGWLATGHEEARAVLGHPRFSNRYELQHPPFPSFGEVMPPAPVGDFLGIDAPEHTRFRKLLAGKFTVRRMRLLTERVEEFTTECLDAMEGQGPSVDLMRAYAQPVPALVICELLGVPSGERERFHQLVNGMLLREGVTPETMAVNWSELQEYIDRLVVDKRANPTDDVLSELTTSDLTHEELVGVGTFLLGAGLHTTATSIGMNVFALLLHPEQLAALRDDPGLTDGAVEELLRYTGLGPATLRAAVEDVEIGGELIKAGECVTISIDNVNRDPRKFVDPDKLDLRRDATGHLTFVHGIHQCLGQHLARIELRTTLPALLTRFPTLRLAIPAEDVQLRTDANMYEMVELPVSWDA
ncbi:cytochrome P450 [Amycolatopsis nigrescens]|uniref:cytochrome P450 n=1 Tax=Amycolatopsis nigrescens TaxID=381445 RepID=UPI00036A8A4F|nr:cytochrome P450 [Amycolatopsis nigrescens]